MRSTNSSAGIKAIFVIAVILAIGTCSMGYQYGTIRSETITIKRLERVTSGDSSKYLIYTNEGEVFENTDALFHGKWDSADLYGHLDEGSRYEVTVYGWRIPFLSTYRNIIEAEQVR